MTTTDQDSPTCIRPDGVPTVQASVQEVDEVLQVDPPICRYVESGVPRIQRGEFVRASSHVDPVKLLGRQNCLSRRCHHQD